MFVTILVFYLHTSLFDTIPKMTLYYPQFLLWFQVFSGTGDRLMSRRYKAAKGNGCGSGIRVGVRSYELMLMFPLGWGSCKLRQQLLRLLKCLIYWRVWHVWLVVAAVVASIVVAVVISMPAHTHTAQPTTDARAGSLWRAHTTIGHAVVAVAGACFRFGFGFGTLILCPSPLLW